MNNNNKKDKVTSQNQKYLSFEGRPGSRGTDTPFKWGRIFGNHVSNKGLVPIIFFKNVYNSITKNQTTGFKHDFKFFFGEMSIQRN